MILKKKVNKKHLISNLSVDKINKITKRIKEVKWISDWLAKCMHIRVHYYYKKKQKKNKLKTNTNI